MGSFGTFNKANNHESLSAILLLVGVCFIVDTAFAGPVETRLHNHSHEMIESGEQMRSDEEDDYDSEENEMDSHEHSSEEDSSEDSSEEHSGEHHDHDHEHSGEKGGKKDGKKGGKKGE